MKYAHGVHLRGKRLTSEKNGEAVNSLLAQTISI